MEKKGPDPPDDRCSENRVRERGNDEINLNSTTNNDIPNEEDMHTLDLSPEDTGRVLRQRIEKAVRNRNLTSYRLVMRDKNGEYVCDIGYDDKLGDLADMSTGYFYADVIEDESLAVDRYDFRTKSGVKDKQPEVESDFVVGEIVLAYWCQGIYPAKVLEVFKYEKWLRYYITYLENDPKKPRKNVKKSKKASRKSKKNKRGKNEESPEEEESEFESYIELDYWRHWVNGIRLMKVSPENVKKMERNARDRDNALKGPIGRKSVYFVRKLDAPEDRFQDSLFEVKTRFEKHFGDMSSYMMMRYLLDAQLSLHLGKMVINPPQTIKDILDKFLDNVLDDFEVDADEIGILESGRTLLEGLFNEHFRRLQYESEKLAMPYDQAEAPIPSERYGGDHLLRLIVKLYDYMDVPPPSSFVVFLQLLLSYLEENQSVIFTNVMEVDGGGLEEIFPEDINGGTIVDVEDDPDSRDAEEVFAEWGTLVDEEEVGEDVSGSAENQKSD